MPVRTGVAAPTRHRKAEQKGGWGGGRMPLYGLLRGPGDRRGELPNCRGEMRPLSPGWKKANARTMTIRAPAKMRSRGCGGFNREPFASRTFPTTMPSVMREGSEAKPTSNATLAPAPACGQDRPRSKGLLKQSFRRRAGRWHAVYQTDTTNQPILHAIHTSRRHQLANWPKNITSRIHRIQPISHTRFRRDMNSKRILPMSALLFRRNPLNISRLPTFRSDHAS